MNRIQNIEQDIENLKKLKKDYESLVFVPNSQEAIEAYHNWYEASCILFGRYFGDDSKEYVNFAYIDNSGNGFGLYNNYQGIRKDFCVLIDRLERGELGKTQQSNIEQISQAQPFSKKRIFISHASKDKELIGKFVDSILLLGMGVDSETIAYTSREDTGVPPGESIPEFIQSNIACADIVLLMISDNYKDSEVCLNEMGAAWALNKYIIQILLPNTSFNKLGWLCSLDKAIKINNPASIDILCEVITYRLDIGIKPTVWNRNKNAFTLYCATLISAILPAIIEPEVVDAEEPDEDEFGFMDYKELLEAKVEETNKVCLIITEAQQECTLGIEANTAKLNGLNPQYPNIAQVKGIMVATAKVMDKLSDVQENNTDLLKQHFFRMVDIALKMRSVSIPNTEEEMITEFDSVRQLLTAIHGAKLGLGSFKAAVDELPKAESTIIKARKRLSNSLNDLLIVLDECLAKGQELIHVVL